MKTMFRITALLALPAVLTACELGPKETEQSGFRGTGMNEIRLVGARDAEEVPAPPYELPAAGPRTAGEVYQNVQVLSDVSDEEFTYLMAAITEWVSPEEGCNYCHNPANLASDEVYTKVVARRMIQMTQQLNNGWKDHVGGTGVTCWTCHRGEPLPSEAWTLPDDDAHRGVNGKRNGQNDPVASTGYSSLPNNAIMTYLLDDKQPGNIKVASAGMYPTAANQLSTMGAEKTYGLMMHMSDSLGVNCTYCHNTQSFREWSLSTPARATAWHGIRMVRDVNANYITPLTDQFPENRLGVMGDPYKVNCSTCHRGLNKPMGGAQMVKDYPALKLAPKAAEPAAAPAADEAAAESDAAATT